MAVSFQFSSWELVDSLIFTLRSSNKCSIELRPGDWSDHVHFLWNKFLVYILPWVCWHTHYAHPVIHVSFSEHDQKAISLYQIFFNSCGLIHGLLINREVSNSHWTKASLDHYRQNHPRTPQLGWPWCSLEQPCVWPCFLNIRLVSDIPTKKSNSCLVLQRKVSETPQAYTNVH